MDDDILPAYDPESLRRLLGAAGLKPLRPLWAKAEIILGLAGACVGGVLLRDRLTHDAVAATLLVLGLYLAAAGHRSHLYQSQNRQTAYLLQVLRSGEKRRRE